MTCGLFARQIGGRWLTWANALTSLRLVAAPLCALAILAASPLAAVCLFALAVATDVVDGRVARRRGEASPLGGLLDHASDATFVSLGLAALAWRGSVTLLLPVLIALAFLQYALDSLLRGGRSLRASWLGRGNGIAYFVLLGTPILRDALEFSWPSSPLVQLFAWGLVATTLASMLDRALARATAP
ncbi:MAG: CDP-alcohol phosphatidyltransferase family protein [Myxococcota bacterium]